MRRRVSSKTPNNISFVLPLADIAVATVDVFLAVGVALVDAVVIAFVMCSWQTLQFLTTTEMFKCCYICHGVETKNV